MQTQSESPDDISFGKEPMQKNIYSDTCSSATTEQATLFDHESSLDGDILIKSLNSSISDARLPSYSINSSMNLSSVSVFNDHMNDMNDSLHINDNLQFAWDSIDDIRSKYLFDIKDQMNKFRNALSLWNEGGFIPLFTNFMGWIAEANQEINNLLNRLASNVILIQRFVKLYKKQEATLRSKSKQLNDIQFENNELKIQNEWLRTELLTLHSTVSTTHQQVQCLNEKHDDLEKSLIETLDDIDEEEEEYMQNVTIFDPLSPQKKRIRNRNAANNILSKSMIITRSTSCRTAKSKKDVRDPFKCGKRVVSRSRSVRTASLKTHKHTVQRNRKRRGTMNSAQTTKSLDLSNMSCMSEKENSLPPRGSIPKPKSRQSVGGITVSAIRKPSASLRRLSYSQPRTDE